LCKLAIIASIWLIWAIVPPDLCLDVVELVLVVDLLPDALVVGDASLVDGGGSPA